MENSNADIDKVFIDQSNLECINARIVLGFEVIVFNLLSNQLNVAATGFERGFNEDIFVN